MDGDFDMCTFLLRWIIVFTDLCTTIKSGTLVGQHQQKMLMLQRPERPGRDGRAGSKTAPSGAV